MRGGRRNSAALIGRTKAVRENFKSEPKKRRILSMAEREQRFMEEYLVDYNVLEAMKRVGYKDPRSAHARKIIARLEPWIAKAQEEKSRQIGAKNHTSQERVLEQLTAQAHYDPLDFEKVEQLPDPKDAKKKITIRRHKHLSELTPEQRMCIKAVTYNPDGTATYTLHDQRGALVLIGKHLGMFNDKLIMEHRHRMMSKRSDLSAVPDAVLEAAEKAFLKHMGPSAARMIGELGEQE